jgi:PIN domain nuclease of toxin-antitoxin system
VIAYLDTQVAVWLAEANLAKLSKKGSRSFRPPTSGCLQWASWNCFPTIAEVALGEGWTRDPFDRLIVAHAKANGIAPLITKDEAIHEHYANARW